VGNEFDIALVFTGVGVSTCVIDTGAVIPQDETTTQPNITLRKKSLFLKASTTVISSKFKRLPGLNWFSPMLVLTGEQPSN